MPEELMPFMERHSMDGEVIQGMNGDHTDT